MSRSNPLPLLRSRNGAALPVALFSLLAISLLVTGVLITSSTEAVISIAHRDAVEDLHAAEGAIAAWIAEREASLGAGEIAAWTPPGGTVPVRIRVEQLSRALPGVGFGAHSLYAVHAEPARREGDGRGVVALIRKREVELPAFAPSFTAALTLGGDSRLTGDGSGEPLVHDGSEHPLCASVEAPATAPVLLALGAELILTAGAAVQGSPSRSASGSAELTSGTLSEISLRDLGWTANVRFGAYFNEPAFPAASSVYSGHADSQFDWSCPAALIVHIRDSAAAATAPPLCTAATDTSRYVVVAIDGENDVVTLAGNHGQGMLVVVNGDLHITGSFVFKGLILAERRILLSGGGPGWPPSIDGALLATGGLVLDSSLTPAHLAHPGSVRAVRFDRCAIDRVVQAVNGIDGGGWRAPRILGKIHGWFEVVR
jgi:hypothetical protein